jgi:hypothetical protein
MPKTETRAQLQARVQGIINPGRLTRRADQWFADGIKESTGYGVTDRQHVALWNIWSLSNAIGAGELGFEGIEFIRDELIAFLAQAGLRGPHYKPSSDAHFMVMDTHDTLKNCNAWARHVRDGDSEKASISSFQVSNYSCRMVWESACMNLIHLGHQKRAAQSQRMRGRDTTRDNARKTHEKMIEHAKKLRKQYPDRTKAYIYDLISRESQDKFGKRYEPDSILRIVAKHI